MYMDSSWLLALIALSQITLVAIALRLPPVPRILVIVQVLYFSISYVARPLVLYWARPMPQTGDSLADLRLAFDGYTRLFNGVLGVTAFGLWTYTAFIGIYALWLHQRGSAARFVVIGAEPEHKQLLSVAVASYILGTVGRILVVLGIPGDGIVLQLMQLLAAFGVGACLLIFKGKNRTTTFSALALIALIELAWSVLQASKTPFMAVLLILAVRLFGKQGINLRRTALVAVSLGVLFFVGFGAIQNVKQSSSVSSEIATSTASYPSPVRPFIGQLRRFDMFSAVTDAYLKGSASWNAPPEFFSALLTTVVPAQLQGIDPRSKDLGVQWATEVRQASLVNSNTNVSLASGFIAEGWVTWGIAGVICQAIFIVAALHVVHILLTSRAVGRFSLGVLCLAYPILFERGILTSAALISKDAQAVLIIFAIGLYVRSSMIWANFLSTDKHKRHVSTVPGSASQASIESRWKSTDCG